MAGKRRRQSQRGCACRALALAASGTLAVTGLAFVGATSASAATPGSAGQSCTGGTGGTCTNTFTTVGNATWTVPAGVTSATFTVDGAQGGSGYYASVLGGTGAEVVATAATTVPSYSVSVGGQGSSGSQGGAGGTNGGGDAGNTSQFAGGGGGYSAVGSGGVDLIIGGGGGGGGGAYAAYGAGGAGGQVGGPGADAKPCVSGCATASGGGGGTTTSGGAGGVGTASANAIAADGSVGAGHDGGAGANLNAEKEAGAGGGGGFYGGGGGAAWFKVFASTVDGGAGGGGGGSSYADPSLTGVSYTTGARSGDGRVMISYPNPVSAGNQPYAVLSGSPLAVPAPGVLAAASGPTALTASLSANPSNGTVTLNADGSFTYTANPGFTGTDSFQYTATDTSGDYAVGTVSIDVSTALASPNPVAFGPVPINTTVTKAVTVPLAGGYTSLQVGAQTGPFTVTQPAPCSATPCTLSVVYRPTAVQSDSGTTQLSECNANGCLPITNNPLTETGSGISVANATPVHFPPTPINTPAAPLTTTITLDAGYDTVGVVTGNTADFWVFYGTTLGDAGCTGSPCVASVGYVPMTFGPETGDTGLWEYGTGVPPLQISGGIAETGSGYSVAATAPDPLDFGAVRVKTTKTLTARVTLDAGFSTVDVITQSGPYAAVRQSCTSTACTLSVTYSPTAVRSDAGATTLRECDAQRSTCHTLPLLDETGRGIAAPVVVTFDSEGGTAVAAQTVVAGGTATAPIAPTRLGWSFDGWYTKPVGGAKWSFGTAITAPRTLYAQWTAATVSPTAVAQGATIKVTGKGFWPGEQVHAVLHSTPLNLGTYTADANGDLSFTATVPAGIARGAHTVVLTGLTSGRAADAALTVTAAHHSSSRNGRRVATTGEDIGDLLNWAIPLLVVGLWMSFAGRRRRGSGQGTAGDRPSNGSTGASLGNQE